ncbi:putative nucleoporin [Clavispora lusitaniae]|uniref:Nucleoporin n=1 Tax=Clavispora lusitaniae TaxID=36911 RepID=A0AA91PVF0_CLALS|nr:putative nucleoporin [Clavispora lusitaniae]
MSILTSVLPGRSTSNGKSMPSGTSSGNTDAKFIAPTLKINNDGLDTLQFQQGGNESGLSKDQPRRFFLPMVLDSVNDVSYKISVPNFGNLPPLRLGSKYITDLIKIDSMVPGDLYGPNYLNKDSGVDNYYFDAENGLGAFSRFEKVSQVDLPDKFFEEYNTTECSTKMGLFPEINRSWIVVDNKLVFWNYKAPSSSFNKSSQFLTIDQIRHSILTVKIVKPKAGVFLKEVSHLLLIATTLDIHIYVIKYDETLNTLDIYNPNLSVNSQGLIVNQFIENEVTNDIYFCGEGDGVNVWRLDYSSSGTFIKNKCDKVCLTKSGLSSVLPIGKIAGYELFTETGNKRTEGATKASSIPEAISQMEIDAERNILYTLSNKSVIRVYKLSPHQEQFSQHSLLTPSEIFKSVSQIFSDSANFKSFSKFRIASIQAISQKESSNVQLIAITNYGNRILLKLGSSPGFSSFLYTATKANSSLKLSVVTMRFPPSKETPKMNPELDSYTRIKQFVAQTVSNQRTSELLKNTKFAKIISPGAFIAVKKTKGSDRLFISSVNYGFLKHNNKLVEDAEFVNINESSARNSENPVYIHDIVQLTPSMNASDTPNGYANILASQYTKKPLQFAVLTNYGLIVYQYRTADQIIGSLKDEVIENFIDENGYEETCSTLLYLACSYGHHNSNDLFKRKASLLFSHAGNNARLVENSQPSSTGQSHLPIQPSEHQPMVEQVVLSDRFYGTCLLISRLFRDFWNRKVFEPLPHIKILPTGSVEVASIKEDNLLIKGLAIEKSQVEFFIGSVIVLLEFFNENLNKIPSLNTPGFSSDPTKVDNEVCTRAEHIAFTSIIRSLNSMKEALSFLMVLIEETQSNQNNFNEIFKYLATTNQLNLLTLTFKDLLLPSLEVKNLIKDLLSSIINKNILKGGSIDLIASSLQGRCGSFCSTDDVYIFKAIENLTRAKNIGSRDNEMKVRCLNNAVALFEQASDSLTLENIENSIDIMLSLDFFTGAVEFLLKLAKRLYGLPNGQPTGLFNASSENSANDMTKKIAENKKRRVQLYDLIFKILTKLDVKAIQVTETHNQLLINDFIELRDATYDTCFASTDKAFHYEFYQWFINQGCSDRLLTVETPYILPFLEEVSSNDLALTELLWFYHAKREQYFPAAKILYSLAISQFNLTLKQRIEYLSRANGFCNCTCPPSLRQQMIQLSALIQELFEVANIQLDLLNTIKNDKRINKENQEVAEKALNFKVQSASELFNSYADPLGYYEICFIIFRVSDYRNPDDIYKRWELYFERIYHDFMTNSKTSKPLYMLISDSLARVGHKLSTNDIVFPVDRLIKLMCKYVQNAVEEDEATQKPPTGAIVDTFVNAGVSYEKLYVTLKSMIEHDSYDMYSGFIKFLKSSEMVYLIQKWYHNDKNLKDAVSSEVIVTMTEYSVENDPIHKWVKTHNTFI